MAQGSAATIVSAALRCDREVFSSAADRMKSNAKTQDICSSLITGDPIDILYLMKPDLTMCLNGGRLSN